MVKHVNTKFISIFLIVTVLTIPVLYENVLGQNSEVMTKEKVKNTLQNLMSGATILSVEPAPLDGFWEGIIESRGQKVIVYADPQGKHIIINLDCAIHFKSLTPYHSYTFIFKDC